MPRRAHVPDLAHRRQVEAMAAYGIPEPDISRVVGIDPKTLRKHYRDELDLGTTKANPRSRDFCSTRPRTGTSLPRYSALRPGHDGARRRSSCSILAQCRSGRSQWQSIPTPSY
jgi:hypothetical protein